MAQLAPTGPVYQAGTLSGNPLATAAGLAVLELLDDEAYVELGSRAARLGAGLAAALSGAGLEVQVPVAGSLVGLFCPEPVTDYDGAERLPGEACTPGSCTGCWIGVWRSRPGRTRCCSRR